MAVTGPELKAWLAAIAADEGFAAVHIGPARLPDYAANGLQQFLTDEFEGDMGWLRDTATRRMDPVAMWPAAKSAIVCVMNYGPDHNPMDNLAATAHGNISVYARGKDYHDVIKGRLKQLASRFVAKSGAAVKVFVDTAPLMEKPLAHQAGAGWQGKHTNLVSRAAGSWLFIGTILTDMELPADVPEADHCGSCSRCVDICPTNAFPAPYRLDARKCISYLTIEHKGQIPEPMRRPIGNRIFGCDDCLAVCPWNKYAKEASETKLRAKVETTLPPLVDLLTLDEAGFRQKFAGTPVRRAGYARFMRNVLVAVGNSGDATLMVAVQSYLDHADPMVRGMAIWAAHQLLDINSLCALTSQYAALEPEPDVLAEWKHYAH